MSWLWMLIPAPIKRALAWVVAGAAAIAAIRWDAKRDAKEDAEAKALRDAAKTKERVDDAIEKSHAGGAAWSDRLRKLDD